MDIEIDFENTYWDRIKGFVSENKIDSRWNLKDPQTDEPLAYLRIVSHPDCPPGHLRCFFNYITSMKNRTDNEILQTVEDYQINNIDLDVFDIVKKIETETIKIEDTKQSLEKIFNVKIFE